MSRVESISAAAPPPSRARRLPRHARRAQLLAAAREVFVAAGYHAAGMDEIAERAGVSKPVLYQHFPGKLELYLALLSSEVDRLIARTREALAGTTDNRERVRASIATYFDFVAGEDEAFRLVLESDLRSEPPVREQVERVLQECAEAISATIAADTGATREEALLLSVGLVGLAEVSARFWLDSEGAVTRERAVELLSLLAWRGIGGFPRTGPGAVG